MPAISQLINHISVESEGTLIVERVENIGGHYAKTLRLWRESFMSNFDAKIKPALIEKHGIMTDDAIAVFRRKWEVSVLHLKNFSDPPLTSAQVLFQIL